MENQNSFRLQGTTSILAGRPNLYPNSRTTATTIGLALGKQIEIQSRHLTEHLTSRLIMWPFRKKPLPPPPAPEPIHSRAAVVRRTLAALDSQPDLMNRIIQVRPDVLVCNLDEVGTLTADMEIGEGDVLLAHWRTWLPHDPHEKKRPKSSASENTIQPPSAEKTPINTVQGVTEPITMTITIPTTAVEQVTKTVTFMGDNGDVYSYQPSEIMPPMT